MADDGVFPQTYSVHNLIAFQYLQYNIIVLSACHQCIVLELDQCHQVLFPPDREEFGWHQVAY
jgi:hypothetical protein